MLSLIQKNQICQGTADAGGSELPLERTQASAIDKKFCLDRQKTFIKKSSVADFQSVENVVARKELDSWLALAQQTFSSPSQEKRGENVFVSSLNVLDGTNPPASQVPDARRTARSLLGGSSQSVQVVVPSLLDYKNTQAENYKKHFNKVKPDIDLYKYKTVRSGDVLEVYEYEGIQKSKEGKERKRKEKDENISVEKTQEQIREIRKKSTTRASKDLKRTINANIGKWGHELPKFLTLTFKEDIKDFRTANYEFKKFHQRLSYRKGSRGVG